MTIETKARGTVNIDSNQCITMPQGLYGFEQLTEYAIIESGQPPFFWYQSTEQPDIAFILLDPLIIWPDYNPDPEPYDLEVLDLKDRNDPSYLEFVIVTIPPGSQTMTANLQGPLIINKTTRQARQCISRNENYKVKHPIFNDQNPDNSPKDPDDLAGTDPC